MPEVLFGGVAATWDGQPVTFGQFTWRAVIGGQQYDLEPGLSIEHRLEDRTAPQLRLFTDDGVHFTKGQPVEVWWRNVRLFAGQVWADTETYWSPTEGLEHNLTLVGWHVLADRRNIARGYDAGTPLGDIVRDIIDILAPDGVTEGDVDLGGVLVDESGFNYVPCSEALDTIAELAGYWWTIDDDKRIHFRPFDANPAPWNIAPAVSGVVEDVLAGTFSLTEEAPAYRNRQYLRGVRTETDPQTETFTGDGETRTFTVGFLLAQAPTVSVDGVAKTVGIRGLQTGFDFYWNKGDRTITQDDSGTRLTSANVLQVVYIGFFDAVLVAEDQEGIDERAAVESTTGVWDHVAESGPEVSGRTGGFQVIAAKLGLFSRIGKRITYLTDREGIKPGQVQTVTVPRHDLHAVEVLVESVTAVRDGRRLRWQVNAVAGPLERSWSRFFGELVRQPRALVFRQNLGEDETLTRLFEFDKTWVEAENPNIFRQVFPSSSLFPSATTFPMFDPQDRLRFIEVYDGSTLTLRKLLTSRVGLDTDEIDTTAYLSPAEANGEVTEVRWVGGWRATQAAGTGVTVATEALVDEKTSAEAWQINRTDTKWS